MTQRHLYLAASVLVACVVPGPGDTSALHVGTTSDPSATATASTSVTSTAPGLATVTGADEVSSTGSSGYTFILDTPQGPPLPPYPPLPCKQLETCPPGSLCLDIYPDGPMYQGSCLIVFDPALYGCDVSLQDCPEGYKCILPWSFYGGGWDGACVPLSPAPIDPAGPCSVLDPLYTDPDGYYFVYPDDCPAGTQCVTPGDNCAAFCVQDGETGKCPLPGHYCGVMRQSTWCIEMCDPLVQDCPEGDTCTFVDWVPGCFLDLSDEEGQVFDPCFDSILCDPGLLCLGPSAANECDPNEQGCCLPYCNLDVPDCPGMGQECLPYFEPGTALEGLEHLGYCSRPW